MAKNAKPKFIEERIALLEAEILNLKADLNELWGGIARIAKIEAGDAADRHAALLERRRQIFRNRARSPRKKRPAKR